LRRAIGMLIGFLGVALLVTPGGAGGAFDTRFVIGALAIQVGAITWQYGTIRGKRRLNEVSPLMSSAFQMLIGGSAVIIAGFAIGDANCPKITGAGIGGCGYWTTFGCGVWCSPGV